jgi:hypothetical protein
MNANESSHHKRESGQVLAFVAVLMVVLLAMLALVLDGGNLYLQRRRMQNAADAGAIAGARILCLNGTADEAWAVAQDYSIVRNRADTADITVGDWSVTVVAHKDVPMTFARIIGIEQIAISAEAEAICGVSGSAQGPCPIAVKNDTFLKVSEGGGEYTLWDSEEEMDPDGGNLSGSNRGWLSLPCAYPDTCTEGANELKEWMVDGYPGSVDTDSYIRPASGEMAAVIQQAYVGQRLIMPVYDVLIDLEGRPYYHLVGFAIFEVTDVISTGTPKGISGHFMDWVKAGPINPGGPDLGLRTVALIR